MQDPAELHRSASWQDACRPGVPPWNFSVDLGKCWLRREVGWNLFIWGWIIVLAYTQQERQKRKDWLWQTWASVCRQGTRLVHWEASFWFRILGPDSCLFSTCSYTDFISLSLFHLLPSHMERLEKAKGCLVNPPVRRCYLSAHQLFLDQFWMMCPFLLSFNPDEWFLWSLLPCP